MKRLETEDVMDKVIFGVVLIAVGLLEAVCPQFLWKYAHGGRKRHAQPTQRDLLISRIGGVTLVVFGALCFFI